MNVMKEIEQVDDHRVDANKEYELADIIFLTIAAVLLRISVYPITHFGVIRSPKIPFFS